MKKNPIRTHFSLLCRFAKNNRMEFIAILILILVASILRLWKIYDYQTFLGDEGRDALVLLNIVRDGKLTLLGPAASVGGFFLGPAYYYLVLPGFILSGLSPVGMSTEVALFGVATVVLLYVFIRHSLGPVPAFSATLLYSVSPVIVIFSRSSWNPNVMPFFALLIFICLYLSSIGKLQKTYIFAAGALFGLAVQSHYLGFLLSPAIFILISIFNFRKISQLLTNYLLCLLGFIATFSPYLMFEIRHGFKNTQTIIEFITKPSGAVGVKENQYSTNLFNAISRLFSETGSIANKDAAVMIGLICMFLAVVSVICLKSRKNSVNFYIIVVVWTVSGILGIGLYNGELYNYYFAFLFPIPVLLFSLAINLFSKSKPLTVIVIAVTLIISGYLLPKNHIFFPPSNQLKTANSVAEEVIRLSNSKPYNFALMATGNTDYAYRFFLEKNKFKPVPIENEITDQLIVVCEQKDCRYNLSPLPQILSFGPKQLDQEVDFIPGHIKIFRLVHESVVNPRK